MSDTARNKELVLAWAEALSSNNTQGVLALYADDIHITTMGSTCISGRYGPAQVRGFVEGFLDTFPQGLKMTIHSMTAEDNRVSAEATGEGHHVSGQEYIQHYHFLFTIRHNRIVELKEYLDTELITRILC